MITEGDGSSIRIWQSKMNDGTFWLSIDNAEHNERASARMTIQEMRELAQALNAAADSQKDDKS